MRKGGSSPPSFYFLAVLASSIFRTSASASLSSRMSISMNCLICGFVSVFIFRVSLCSSVLAAVSSALRFIVSSVGLISLVARYERHLFTIVANLCQARMSLPSLAPLLDFSLAHKPLPRAEPRAQRERAAWFFVDISTFSRYVLC